MGVNRTFTKEQKKTFEEKGEDLKTICAEMNVPTGEDRKTTTIINGRNPYTNPIRGDIFVIIDQRAATNDKKYFNGYMNGSTGPLLGTRPGIILSVDNVIQSLEVVKAIGSDGSSESLLYNRLKVGKLDTRIKFNTITSVGFDDLLQYIGTISEEELQNYDKNLISIFKISNLGRVAENAEIDNIIESLYALDKELTKMKSINIGEEIFAANASLPEELKAEILKTLEDKYLPERESLETKIKQIDALLRGEIPATVPKPKRNMKKGLKRRSSIFYSMTEKDRIAYEAAIVSQYETDKNIAKLARQFNLSPSTITRIIDKKFSEKKK